MKQTFILWCVGVMITLASSCSNAPDNVIHKQETRPGDWVYDSVLGKPVQKQEVYYQISPTFGQALTIASHRTDHSGKLALSIAFGALFVFLVLGQIFHLNYVPRWYEENAVFNGAFNLVILGACLYFLLGDAVGITNNNDKWVSKEKYDNAIKSGSTQSIWDEYEANFEIVDGPYK